MLDAHNYEDPGRVGQFFRYMSLYVVLASRISTRSGLSQEKKSTIAVKHTS